MAPSCLISGLFSVYIEDRHEQETNPSREQSSGIRDPAVCLNSTAQQSPASDYFRFGILATSFLTALGIFR